MNHLANFAAKLKLANEQKKPFFFHIANKEILEFTVGLEQQDLIMKYEIYNFEKNKIILVFPKYKKQVAVIKKIKFFVKVSQKFYFSTNQLKKLCKEKNSILLLTTNKGILNKNQAIQQNVGGKPICYIYL